MSVLEIPRKRYGTQTPRFSLPFRIREHIPRIQPFSIMAQACAVGLITGGGAIVYDALIHLVQWVALSSDDYPLHVLPELPWYRILLVPTLGGLAVGLVALLRSRDAQGHGVPEVIESVALGNGKFRWQTALVKSVSSALTIGSGGSVGREGPIVHIGASLGSVLGQLLKVPPDRLPTLAGCGVAGGIAAVFNAPIAGAFFALEVVIGNFAMPAFGPVMLSSVLATVVSRAYFGDHPAFVVPAYTLLSSWELLFYIGLGIVCGLGGLAFMFSLDRLEKSAENIPLPQTLKPALGGFLVGCLILMAPHVYGTGHGTMDSIVRGGLEWWYLLLLFPIKIAATSLTLASGGSGGLFLPALYLGAILGSLCGISVGAIFPTIAGPSGGYALVGMAAFLAGVVHCPITAFLLLFEITTAYDIILPLMVSCTVSTVVAKLFREESIYTLQLLRRGIDIRRREQTLMQGFTVGQVMRPEPPTFREGVPFPTVMNHFLASTLPLSFVIDEDRHLLGIISIHDVKALLQDDNLTPLVVAVDLARPPDTVITAQETLVRCLEKFSQSEQEYLPVLSAEQHLEGVISRSDVLNLYNREILRNEYLGVSLRSEALTETVHEQVHLPHEYTVEIVPVPPALIGRTLGESQLRRRFNVTAIALRRGGFHGPDELPDPDIPLRQEDYLVLVGRAEHCRQVTDMTEKTGIAAES